MEVHFTPGQEAQLAEIASTAGTDLARLVRKAAFKPTAPSSSKKTK